MIRAAAIFALAATGAAAQGAVETLDLERDPGGFVQTIEPDRNIVISPLDGPLAPPEPRVLVEAGTGAVLRWLDKVSGDVREVELAPGEARTMGRIEVRLGDCRYPVNNPTGEAFAWLDIRSEGRERPDFSGWMLASSPALSALDHPRYDVWVIRCTTA